MERTLLELSAHWNFSTVDKPVRPMNLANALKQMVAVARAGSGLGRASEPGDEDHEDQAEMAIHFDA